MIIVRIPFGSFLVIMFIACSSSDIYKVVFHHNVLPQLCDISARNNDYDYGINMSSQIIVIFSKTENITVAVSCIILLSFLYFKNQKAAYIKVFPSYRAAFNRCFALVFEGFMYSVFYIVCFCFQSHLKHFHQNLTIRHL